MTAAAVFFLFALAILAWPLLVTFINEYFNISFEMVATVNGIRFLLAALLLIALFSTFYMILPNRNRVLHPQWPGALLAAILWLTLAQAFSFYLMYFAHYDATYGSIGGFIITLVFFHYSASAILLGAELNCVLEHRSTPDSVFD